MLKKLLLFSAAMLIFGAVGHGQDSQSLGEAARQARLKKQQQEAAAATDQQAKDPQAKDPQAKDPQSKDAAGTAAPPAKPRVITNDEIPSHVGPTSPPPSSGQRQVAYEPPAYASGRSGADAWKAQIQGMKSRISSLETEIARVNESVHFASGNCVANCVQHNERQLQKQQQVESMKAQLDEQQKQLEQMQETARKQGFGSSVYDP